MSNMVISSGLYCLGLGLFLLQVLSVSMQELLQCGIVRCECLHVFALVYLSSCPLTVSFLRSKLSMCLYCYVLAKIIKLGHYEARFFLKGAIPAGVCMFMCTCISFVYLF